MIVKGSVSKRQVVEIVEDGVGGAEAKPVQKLVVATGCQRSLGLAEGMPAWA
jgi:hypothetical protein